jgi:hypothetical protein
MDILKYFPTVTAIWSKLRGRYKPLRTLQERVNELIVYLGQFLSKRRAIRIAQIVIAKDPNFDLSLPKYESLKVYLTLAVQEFQEIVESLERDGGLAIAEWWQSQIEYGHQVFTPAYLQGLAIPGM